MGFKYVSKNIIKGENEMDNKLLMSAAQFNLACLDKLSQKGKEGWGGWDNPEYEKEFEGKIVIQSLPLIQNDCVNIANYYMFLWNLMEVKNKGENEK